MKVHKIYKFIKSDDRLFVKEGEFPLLLFLCKNNPFKYYKN